MRGPSGWSGQASLNVVLALSRLATAGRERGNPVWTARRYATLNHGSQTRAENVMEYLSLEGVKPSLVSAHGFGDGVPVASNDLGVFAARSRRGSSVGRTRGVLGRLWRIRSGRSVSRLMMAAQQVPPEGHECGVTAGSGVFGMVDGVICVNMRVSLATDLRGVRSHATTRPEVGRGRGCGDHGAMACRGESVRINISRP
jgi:hypothetical protein